MKTLSIFRERSSQTLLSKSFADCLSLSAFCSYSRGGKSFVSSPLPSSLLLFFLRFFSLVFVVFVLVFFVCFPSLTTISPCLSGLFFHPACLQRNIANRPLLRPSSVKLDLCFSTCFCMSRAYPSCLLSPSVSVATSHALSGCPRTGAWRAHANECFSLAARDGHAPSSCPWSAHPLLSAGPMER